MQQADIDSIPQKEPAVKHNLPVQPTPLVGREQAVEAACRLLQGPDVRLLTLTGPAGVGKTRLALQVATELLDDFADGVSFVPLASLRDPDGVMAAIAHPLELQESPDLPFFHVLKAYLQDRRMLLLLDNFEQVLPAGSLLADLLSSCPGLKLLVSSRAVLHLRAEHRFLVPPLALPHLAHLPALETLAQYAAITLFTQRAQAIKPGFVLTHTNARAVAEICVRLDGLPLAIELAAARITLLSPQALLARLDHRLQLLTHGPADLPERQQTLRKTIMWSYDLLKPEEQRLFRRLSVFVGGCTLEAIEAVCAAHLSRAAHTMQAVASLIDKSLLHHREQEGEEPRLVLLETLREYGLEALEAAGELKATQAAHARYYLQLAEQAEPKLVSAVQVVWLERLEREHENLRTAMRWSLQEAEARAGEQDRAIALRLGGALVFFWGYRGHFSEGRIFLEQALAADRGVAAAVRAKALYSAAALAYFQGDYRRGEEFQKEGLKLYRELAALSPEVPTFQLGMALALNGLAYPALLNGDHAAVQTLCEESLPLLKQLGDRWKTAEALFLLAHAFHGRGESARARAACTESLTLCREVGERLGIAITLFTLGYFASRQGDFASARMHYEESLAVSRELGAPFVIGSCLAGLGEVLLVQGQPAGAARLLAAAEGFSETLGLNRVEQSTVPFLRFVERDAYERYERVAAAARVQLGKEAFAAAWAEGRAMTPEQALAAQERATTPAPLPPIQPPLSPMTSPPTSLHGLTNREMEVLRLLAMGLTSTQIAEQLVISLLTVNTHVRSIYSKLGVTSRAAATRYAIEHHLV